MCAVCDEFKAWGSYRCPVCSTAEDDIDDIYCFRCGRWFELRGEFGPYLEEAIQHEGEYYCPGCYEEIMDEDTALEEEEEEALANNAR
jgi:DNA-directed RNA polymerase subunit RPC12/RpoP